MGKLRKSLAPGAASSVDLLVGDHRLDAFLLAHGADAADSQGAAHETGGAGPAGAVGHEGLRADALEGAQHAAQGLRVGAHGALRRRGAQQVHLDGDALAGPGERAPAPEGGDGALESRGEPLVVLRVGDVGNEPGPLLGSVAHAGFSHTIAR